MAPQMAPASPKTIRDRLESLRLNGQRTELEPLGMACRGRCAPEARENAISGANSQELHYESQVGYCCNSLFYNELTDDKQFFAVFAGRRLG